MLGAASIQIAFNLGNALGAWCGGMPVKAGFGYEYTALPAGFFAFLGFVLLFYFWRRYEYPIRLVRTTSHVRQSLS